MAKRFYDWIKKEPRGPFDILSTVIMALVAYSVWLIVVGLTTHWTLDNTMHKPDLYFTRIPFWLLTIITFAGALLEELVFRMIPLQIGVRFWKSETVVLTVIIISSVAFGLIHVASTGSVIGAEMRQGVGGIIFSCLYLKSGGWRGAILKPLAITTLAHGLFDTLSFFMAMILISNS